MKTVKKNKIDLGPAGTVIVPVMSAVIVVAAAVAYICLKLVNEIRYNEKWKDYDECGWH